MNPPAMAYADRPTAQGYQQHSSNDGDIQDRLVFLKIDEQAKQALREFLPTLEGQLDSVLEGFYNHVGKWPKLSGKFSDSSRMAHARRMQAEHWKNLFSAAFDQNYVNRVNIIGRTHERHDIEPRFYLGGYAFALSEMISLAVKTYANQPDKIVATLQAVLKASFLDMDYAISIYNDTVRETAGTKLSGIISSLEEVLGDVGELNSNVGTVAGAVEESSGNIKTVFQASEKIANNIKSAGQTTTKMSQNMQDVSDSTEEMTMNLNSMANAMEEMSASLNEVSKNTSHASKIAATASDNANNTKETVNKMGQSAFQIVKVVDIIGDIAAQTNLLALNASIEAANAGDAGRGFAVVANEVKALAKQASESADVIRSQIEGMQLNANEAVTAINQTVSVIEEINQINHTIATAVEEQSATTNEITENVSKVAVAAKTVSEKVQVVTTLSNDVAGAMEESTQGINQITQNMDELSKGSTEMAKTSQEAASRANNINRNLTEVNESTRQTIREVTKQG